MNVETYRGHEVATDGDRLVAVKVPATEFRTRLVKASINVAGWIFPQGDVWVPDAILGDLGWNPLAVTKASTTQASTNQDAPASSGVLEAILARLNQPLNVRLGSRFQRTTVVRDREGRIVENEYGQHRRRDRLMTPELERLADLMRADPAARELFRQAQVHVQAGDRQSATLACAMAADRLILVHELIPEVGDAIQLRDVLLELLDRNERALTRRAMLN